MTKDPQAVALLTQFLNAAGGLSAISSIQDFTGTGTITYNWAAAQYIQDVMSRLLNSQDLILKFRSNDVYRRLWYGRCIGQTES